MEARCTGRKARGWRRLAAYGSSGLEDGAQDGDLEKRHMLSVRTSKRYRGVSASGGWWAGGWWAQGEDCGQYRPRVGAVFALVKVSLPFGLGDDHPAMGTKTSGWAAETVLLAERRLEMLK